MWRKNRKRRQNILISLAFNKVVILATAVLVGIFAFRAEVPNFPGWQEISTRMEVAAKCEERQSGEPIENCVDRGTEIDTAFQRLVDAIDQQSLTACRETFGADLDAVWECAKLNDGRDLAAVYRRPGEGD